MSRPRRGIASFTIGRTGGAGASVRMAWMLLAMALAAAVWLGAPGPVHAQASGGWSPIEESGDARGAPAPGAPAAPPPAASREGGASPAAPSGEGTAVRFHALLVRGGAPVTSGLVWRVYEPRPGPDGRYRLLATHKSATPLLRLAPGDYLVVATLGRAYVVRKITVRAGPAMQEEFVLNAGGLRLRAMMANGDPIPARNVTYDIYSDERDQFGKRKKVLSGLRSSGVIRLNSGIYHVVSTYGDANAVVEADVTVEAGKLTEASVYHAAGRVTFKLVARPGGEALADTKWRVLDPAGRVVKESAGALPTHILAAGRYRVLAHHGDGTFRRSFAVGIGEAREIEVVTGE